MERRLEPKEQEAKIIGRCPICGEELYEGYEYTMFGGKMLCGSQECYKAILKRIVTLTDFEAYAKSQYEDFALWGKGRIMEAIEKGRKIPESIFYDYAYEDFEHFADWYYETMDSGELIVA